MLELRGVSKSVRGKPHIHPTDLTLHPGTMNVLLGPTLSGKTSLMRLMAGLESPTSGRVEMDPPIDSGPGEIAFVFQQPTLLRWRTALDNAILSSEIDGRSRPEARAEATRLFGQFGLSGFEAHYPAQLSGDAVWTLLQGGRSVPVDAFSGATITPRGVVAAIREGLLFFQDRKTALTSTPVFTARKAED